MTYLLVIPMAVIAATLAAYRTHRGGVAVFIAAYFVCVAMALGGGFIAHFLSTHFLIGAALGAAFGAATFATLAMRPRLYGRGRLGTLRRRSAVQ